MGGYSHVDSGGVKVDCPLCLGKGEMKTLEYAAKDAEEKIKSRKKKEIAIDSEENVIL